MEKYLYRCAARAGDAALVMYMATFMKTQQYTASSLLNIFPSMSCILFPHPSYV